MGVHVAVAQNVQVTLMADNKRFIEADLQSGNYFYYKPDGTRVEYLRKKDVYVLPQGSTSASISKRLQASWVAVDTHALGQRLVVKRSPSKTNSALNYSSIAAQLPTGAMPIFANSQGQGDLEILPAVTLAFAEGVDVSKAIIRLHNQYNLRLQRKVKIGRPVYTFAMRNAISDIAQVFSLVRQLASSPQIAWAEPQINEKPVRHFQPNDALFAQQWHLHNTTQLGALCDADCDAILGWDINTGAGTVIAVLDDGVQLDHPDLQANIWENMAEKNGTPSVDDDGNGYVDDINGYDFVVDGTCNDGSAGQDTDPSPQPAGVCQPAAATFTEDNHGTAVAGVAAAVGNNSSGVAGLAYDASILPLRIISDYDTANESTFCLNAAEAMSYAGRYADVVNNSWGMSASCAALETAIADVVSGTIMDDGSNVSKRPNKGSPVIFSSGNSAAGWYKVTIDNVPAGERSFEWRFAKDSIDFFTTSHDQVWLDSIVWPDGSTDDFDAGSMQDFSTGCVLNRCTLVDGACNNDATSCATQWALQNESQFVRDGSGFSMTADLSDAEAICDYTYLQTVRTMDAGPMSFWIWASADLLLDQVEFLIDGVEYSSFGDVAVQINNDVAYPANLPSTIAVGASNDGVFGDTDNGIADQAKEERVYYSQYGASLDVVAPSSNQHQGISTTDRTGADGYNSTADLLNGDYTDWFGGTSAAAPLVSGIAASMISVNSNLTAAQVKQGLQDSADQIGPYQYDGDGFNTEVGHGRVNMFQALRIANGSPANAGSEACLSVQPFSLNPVYAGLSDADSVVRQCASLAPDLRGQLCFPIPLADGNKAVVVCL